MSVFEEPPKRDKILKTTATAEEVRRAEELAEQLGMSVAELIRHAINSVAKQHRKKSRKRR